MKRTLIAVVLLLTVVGLTGLAAAETVFESKSYLKGEAGLIAPLELKSTNLSGPTPDFAKDYKGEGGLVNPIDKHMEK
jgi:hypothetical protein